MALCTGKAFIVIKMYVRVLVLPALFSQLSELSIFCMFCIKPILLANNNFPHLVFRQTCKRLRNEVVKYSFAKDFSALY